MRKNFTRKICICFFALLFTFSACSRVKNDTQNQGQKSVQNQNQNAENVEIKEAAKESVFPKRQSFVNDFAGVLDKDERQKLESVLNRLKIRAEVDFAITVIDSTDGKSIRNYSLEMARDWEISGENGGILLVIAVKDRRWRIQVDGKLEQYLSDDEINKIGEIMTADLAGQNYFAGLKKCVGKIIDVLAERQKFEPIEFQD